MKINYTRKMAYYAYNFYTSNDVNYTETSNFISNLFGLKLNANDIGRMFRHIVIFGNNLSTARQIVNIVNKRTKHNTYGKYLEFRFSYPIIKNRFDEMYSIIFNAEKYKSYDIDSFIFSEDEKEILKMYSELEKDYIKSLEINYEEYLQLMNKLNYIETMKIRSLL